MKRRFIATLLPCLAFLGAWAGAQPAEDQFRFGLAAYVREGDRAAAKQAFARAIELNPKHGAARFNLGLIAEDEERWNDAIKWYSEYRALDGSGIYGDLAARKIHALRQFAELDKTPDGRAERIYLQLLHRAQGKLAKGDIGAALALSELAIHQRPDRFEGFLIQGLSLIEAERFADALKMLQSTQKLAPSENAAEIANILERCKQLATVYNYVRAGDAALTTKDYAAAGTAFGKAWALDAKPELGLEAARAWTLAGDRSRALKIYDVLLRSDEAAIVDLVRQERSVLEATSQPRVSGTSNPAQHLDFLKARQLSSADKHYEADAVLTQLLEGLLPDKSYAVLFEARAAARLELREYAGALSDATLAIVLDATRPSAYEGRARIHAAQRRYDEAVRDIGFALERCSKDAEVRLRRLRDDYSSKTK